MPFAILATDSTGAFGVGLAGAAPRLEDWRVLSELGVGVVAVTGPGQMMADQAIALLGDKVAPRDAVGRLAVDLSLVGWQLLLLDSNGQGAARSYPGCEPSFGQTTGTDHVAAGVALRSPNVIGAMSLSFERSVGDALAERLLFALESGERAGGDVHGLRSSAIQVVSADPALTLRVDDHPDPIAELRRLYRS
jgi:uncharacterized Ntn-hydrolase superfamily protein